MNLLICQMNLDFSLFGIQFGKKWFGNFCGQKKHVGYCTNLVYWPSFASSSHISMSKWLHGFALHKRQQSEEKVRHDPNSEMRKSMCECSTTVSPIHIWRAFGKFVLRLVWIEVLHLNFGYQNIGTQNFQWVWNYSSVSAPLWQSREL